MYNFQLNHIFLFHGFRLGIFNSLSFDSIVYWILSFYFFVSGMNQINNLEKELEFAKRKKDQLAAYLEMQRKQKAAEHGSADTKA